jgi:hypothetical protein
MTTIMVRLPRMVTIYRARKTAKSRAWVSTPPLNPSSTNSHKGSDERFPFVWTGMALNWDGWKEDIEAEGGHKLQSSGHNFHGLK